MLNVMKREARKNNEDFGELRLRLRQGALLVSRREREGASKLQRESKKVIGFCRRLGAGDQLYQSGCTGLSQSVAGTRQGSTVWLGMVSAVGSA